VSQIVVVTPLLWLGDKSWTAGMIVGQSFSDFIIVLSFGGIGPLNGVLGNEPFQVILPSAI
jgi:hypothetical protein